MKKVGGQLRRNFKRMRHYLVILQLRPIKRTVAMRNDSSPVCYCQKKKKSRFTTYFQTDTIDQVRQATKSIEN